MGTDLGYTLGLDIGTNSIGWCGIARSPDGAASSIVGIGVRIFADGRDPKSKTSLAVERREKRAMRRRRDRYLRRRQALLALLVEYGLLPNDRLERKALELVNPYIVRAAALDGPIPLHHFGRILFHLNQRRGFKSNRKTDKGDPESGKIAQATSKLRLAMQEYGSRTFGEFLAHRLARGLPLRIRMQPGEGPPRKDGAATEGYAFYPDRDLLDDEFRAIWSAQSQHHGDQLTAGTPQVRCSSCPVALVICGDMPAVGRNVASGRRQVPLRPVVHRAATGRFSPNWDIRVSSHSVDRAPQVMTAANALCG